MRKPFKKGNIPWNKGKKGLQTAWNKGTKMSKDDWLARKFDKTGIKHSEKHKKFLGNILKEVGKKTRFQKGQIVSGEIKKKMSENSAHNKYWLGKTNPYMLGGKNWQWKGGITPENKRARKTVAYKEWRRKTFERDRYTCRVCHVNGYIQANHIYPFRSHKELRHDINNGITLCVPCHRFIFKREHLFIKLFQGILEKGFNSEEISKETTPSQQEQLRKVLWACVTVSGE